MVTHRRSRRRAQTLVEYGILIALLTVVALAILSVAGRKTSDVFVSTADALVTQTTGGGSTDDGHDTPAVKFIY